MSGTTVLDTAANDAFWGADLPSDRIVAHLSPAAIEEARRFIRNHPQCTPGNAIETAVMSCPNLGREVELLRERVERRQRMVLLQGIGGPDFHERRAFAWLVANLFGEPIVQNQEGHRFVSVWARAGGKRVVDGARYHQTREGGGPHTDNVSIPEKWEYLVFSCIRPAHIGGESILLSGFSVHQALLGTVPGALDILRQPFWWEYRGISSDLFEAPIITYDVAGEPHFRYLRKYMESAHQRAGVPLTAEQVWALDCLEAILDLTHLQYRRRIEEGEILITHDSQVLHARTFFCDGSAYEPADAAEAASGPFRFFDRVWAKKRR